MAKYAHLSRAPITEALIDIRIKLREDLTVDKLNDIYKSISSQYPDRREHRQFQSRFELKESEPSQAVVEIDKVDGYLCTSADKKQIVQLRLDGFTFSRLQPYENWERLRDEAKRLWKIYQESTSPEITRVALRYINKFDIPQPFKDFSDYLAAAPIVPRALPQGLSSFLTRLVISESSIDAIAIVTQALEQTVDPKFVPIILDIDVFRQTPAGMSEDEAWKLIEKLRDFKNKIFFESITEPLKEMLL